jgi:Ca-activated chloride channel family protein
MMHRIIPIFLSFSSIAGLQAQQADVYLRKGNEFYKQQKFAEAEKEFSKALEKQPDSKPAVNNLASSLYRQQKNEEAKKQFEKLAAGENDNITKSVARYNIGVVLSKEKKLEESIEAYKESLRLNPDDKQARENLQKALLELKGKQQPEKKKENKNKKQQQENQQKQPQSKLNRREVEKQLQLLQQKEKEVKQRMQNEKLKEGGANPKDW